MDFVKKPRKRSIWQTTRTAIACGAIFLLGWAVGSERITIFENQLFRKSIQQSATKDLDYSSVEEVYDSLRRSYDGQLDVNELLDGLKSGLTEAAGDPYTEFLDEEAAQAFDEQLNGTFSGIGAELSENEDGNIVVVAPLAGFPAEKAGLLPKDIVAEVDGKTTADMTVTEVVNKIRGESGTKVKLTIIRDRKDQLDFEITRAQISVASVESEILPGNIGYIKITRFGDDTVKLTKNAAKELKSNNVKGVVLDMRGNPGGLLDAAVGISGVWLESGQKVLEEKRNDVVVKTFRANGNSELAGIPTIVLINEGSASASEIVAGALRDNGVAKLYGMKTFGKGSVQQLEKFGDGSVLKVTIARWYTPKGTSIDKNGLKPDKKIDRSAADVKADRDPQLDAALKTLRQ